MCHPEVTPTSFYWFENVKLDQFTVFFERGHPISKGLMIEYIDSESSRSPELLYRVARLSLGPAWPPGCSTLGQPDVRGGSFHMHATGGQPASPDRASRDQRHTGAISPAPFRPTGQLGEATTTSRRTPGCCRHRTRGAFGAPRSTGSIPDDVAGSGRG